MKPDILADLPRSKRREREHADTDFMLGWKHPVTGQPDNYATKEAIEAMEKRGRDTSNMQEWDGETVPDDGEDLMAICGRCDLDHPILSRDNQFSDCTDCGCGIQFTDNVGPIPVKLCVCCAARRAREASV